MLWLDGERVSRRSCSCAFCCAAICRFASLSRAESEPFSCSWKELAVEGWQAQGRRASEAANGCEAEGRLAAGLRRAPDGADPGRSRVGRATDDILCAL